MWIQPTKGESEKNDQPLIEATSKATHGREEWLTYVSEEQKEENHSCWRGYCENISRFPMAIEGYMVSR